MNPSPSGNSRSRSSGVTMTTTTMTATAAPNENPQDRVSSINTATKAMLELSQQQQQQQQPAAPSNHHRLLLDQERAFLQSQMELAERQRALRAVSMSSWSMSSLPFLNGPPPQPSRSWSRSGPDGLGSSLQAGGGMMATTSEYPHVAPYSTTTGGGGGGSGSEGAVMDSFASLPPTSTSSSPYNSLNSLLSHDEALRLEELTRLETALRLQNASDRSRLLLLQQHHHHHTALQQQAPPPQQHPEQRPLIHRYDPSQQSFLNTTTTTTIATAAPYSPTSCRNSQRILPSSFRPHASSKAAAAVPTTILTKKKHHHPRDGLTQKIRGKGFPLPSLQKRTSNNNNHPEFRHQFQSFRVVWDQLDRCSMKHELFRRRVQQGKIPIGSNGTTSRSIVWRNLQQQHVLLLQQQQQQQQQQRSHKR